MRLRTQDLTVECLVSLHVRQLDTQKILKRPGDSVKLNHIRTGADRFFKSPKRVLRVVGESYGHVGHKPCSQARPIDDCPIACDDPRSLQLLNPSQAGGGRQPDSFGQLQIGLAGVP
ncbi:hypothetical protein D3C84_593750 [compost metagenome]